MSLSVMIENPGVSPPDGDILFCWPKREDAEKGMPLAWSTPARISGVINAGTAGL
jgi:hypothetical protein